jgi:ATP synthase A1 C subunit
MSEIVALLIFTIIGALFTIVILYTRSIVPYAYSLAKVSAWEARIISRARLNELADMPKVADVFEALQDTDYRTFFAEISKMERVDMMEVERAIKNQLSQKYRELLEIAPKDRRQTIAKIIQQTDVWNLKAIITSIHNKLPREKRLDGLIPSPTLPMERLKLLASAENFRELLEYFKGTEYFEPFSSALKDYERVGLLAILSAVDRHYFLSLWREVLSRRSQRSILKQMVGYEIDAINIKLILRLKNEGASPEEISRYVILPSFQLTEDIIRSMIVAPDVASAIDVASYAYGKIFSGVFSEFRETKSLSVIERALDEWRLGFFKWLSLTKPFTVAPLLYYIRLKEVEGENLRTIIRLKMDGIKADEIKKSLLKVPEIEL